MHNSAWPSVPCFGTAVLRAVLSPESEWMSCHRILLLTVLPALPWGCWGKQGKPGSQTGLSQLTFLFSILLSFGTASAVAVAARMGSCPWLGVQVFFHGAIELAGKVTSAAWLEPGSGGAGYRNLLVDFWQSVSAACSTLRPPGPGGYAQQGD